MGRPSKLNERQWGDIKRRIAGGEKPADLAREYGVSRQTISERCQKRAETIKDVAHQLVSADAALRQLPVSEQLLTLNLADDLRATLGNMAKAARYSSATSHRLAGIAHAKVQEIDDAAPLNAESIEALKGVAALTELANKAAFIPLNLIGANKEAVRDMSQQAKPLPQAVTVTVEDASVPDAQAQ